MLSARPRMNDHEASINTSRPSVSPGCGPQRALLESKGLFWTLSIDVL